MSRHCDFTPSSCTELHNVSILVEKTETRVTNLEGWQDKLDSRLSKVQWFLIGIFATSAGSLLAIVLGFLFQRN